MTACPGFTTSNIRSTALSNDGTAHGETSMEEEKMMTAEEVAKIIANGIEKRERVLVMTRQGKLTVLLNKLIPGWLDKKVYDVFTKEKNPLLR